MEGLFIIDSVAFINYFGLFFGEENKLSDGVRKIIDRCFDYSYPTYKLSIPGVVFIEVSHKFLKDRETVLKFRYEIYSKIENNIDVEIKSIDKEVLGIFSKIDDNIIKLEYHDKIIAASAMQLQRPLITCDTKIETYIRKSKAGIPTLF